MTEFSTASTAICPLLLVPSRRSGRICDLNPSSLLGAGEIEGHVEKGHKGAALSRGGVGQVGAVVGSTVGVVEGSPLCGEEGGRHQDRVGGIIINRAVPDSVEKSRPGKVRVTLAAVGQQSEFGVANSWWVFRRCK